MIKNAQLKLLLPIALLGIAGCSSQQTEPESEAPAFGDAVRSVMNSQISDYEAAIHPEPNAVEGSDPYRLDSVLSTYREHVSAPEEVRAPLSINVNGN